MLRIIFCNRAHRLSVLFLLALVVHLTLAIYFPLWVLAIGPVIFGFPHLISSLRYLHYNIAAPSQLSSKLKISIYTKLTLLFGSIALSRIASNFFQWPLELGTWPEIISALIAFFISIFHYGKKSIQVILGSLFVGGLIYSSWTFPLETAGSLILIHNFIAFVHWVVAAKNRAELLVSCAATIIFVAVNILIFSGTFDFLYMHFQPSGTLPWANLEYSSLGKLIAPWSTDYHFWFHAVVAYAFGQSLHYFVWLKAIPDQYHYHTTPTSFIQAGRLLVQDFGKKLFLGITILLIAGSSLWLVMSFPEARIAYFAIAAYHGYLEIVSVALSAPKWHEQLS